MSLKLYQLKDLARNNNIKGFSSMKKDELNQLLYKEGLLDKDGKATDEKKETNKTEYYNLSQLGRKGKEGTVYLTVDMDNPDKFYAKKQFKMAKSSLKIEKEAGFQKIAAEAGISPKIVDVNLKEKFIVMEKLDKTLYEILKQQQCILTVDQQKQILDLYKKLDEVGIFMNDANPLNIMEKDGRLYIIDFGFAKYTSHKDLKKYRNPNYQLMPVALLSWVKNKCPTKSWTVIRDSISDSVYESLKIKDWP